MVNNQWVEDLQNIIFSKIKVLTNAKLKTEYPKMVFTTSPIDTSKATFPTVYIHEIQNVEIKPRLERQVVNAIDYTIQIEVFANDTNKIQARRIAYVVDDVLKSMSFTGKSFPSLEYETNYTRCISRYNKIICSNDTL